MKANKIRENTDEELLQLYRERRKELFDLRAMISIGGASEQPMRLRTLRREIAQVRTVMRERELKDGGRAGA